MNNWKKYKLGDVVNLKRGYDLPQQNRLIGKIPIYSSAGLSGFHNEFKAKGPGVITGRYGTLGELFYTEGNYWPHNTTLYVTDFKGNFPKFIYFFLKTLGFNNQNDKTSVPGLNRNHLHEIEVSIPDISTQERIASILSSLDDKIELNRHMNQTLEQIAATLFKKYFVDDIDPDNLPEGWRWGKMNELFSHSKDSLNPGKFSETTFSHYSILAFDEGLKPSLDKGESILSNKFYVKSNSILFSKLNPRFPRIWAINEVTESTSICSTEFLVFVPKGESLYSYCYSQLAQKHVIDDLISKATGTSGSHQRVRPEDILSLEVVVPSQDALMECEKIVRPFIKRKQQNIKENLNLASIRDSLLPKLMSGEIDLSAINQNEALHAEVFS